MQEEKPIEEYVVPEDFKNKENKGFWAKINHFLDGRYFMPVLVVLAIITAFFLGRLSVIQDKKIPVRVISDNTNNPLNPPYIKGETEQDNPVPAVQQAAVVSASQNGSAVVASKNGTKYHYPWCAGAKQISAQNLVTFPSIESARAKGYTPASNCKGLK